MSRRNLFVRLTAVQAVSAQKGEHKLGHIKVHGFYHHVLYSRGGGVWLHAGKSINLN